MEVRLRHNSGMQAQEDNDGFAIVRVDLEDGGVCMEAIGTAEEAACPSCGALAVAVHGQYQRWPVPAAPA